MAVAPGSLAAVISSKWAMHGSRPWVAFLGEVLDILPLVSVVLPATHTGLTATRSFANRRTYSFVYLIHTVRPEEGRTDFRLRCARQALVAGARAR